MKDFFYFSRNQRLALCVLLCLLFPLFLLGRYLLDRHATHKEQLTVQIDSLSQTLTGAAGAVSTQEVFPFDPNTADEAALRRLGLSNHAVRSLLAYRAKGGVVRTPEKFAAIYGVTPTDYARLAPYIRIPARQEGRAVLPSAASAAPAMPALRSLYPVKYPSGTVLDLNSVDTAELKRIPGIGTWRARSIVRYRERLGGFASVAQLREIADLPDSLLRNFRIGVAVQPSLRINELSVKELVAHPYLSYEQAIVLIEHRRKYGRLTSLAPLGMYEEFSDVALRQLEPYVRY
jgi:DNA uptake protein ComE-like DNA-binding protein